MKYAAYKLVESGSIGSRIQNARENKNMTRTELANAVGTTYRRVLEWESDQKKPSYGYLKVMCDVLDVEYLWLCDGTLAHEPHFYQKLVTFDQGELTKNELKERANMLNSIACILPSFKNETLELANFATHLLYEDIWKEDYNNGDFGRMDVLIETYGIDQLNKLSDLIQKYQKHYSETNNESDDKDEF